eukprot:1133657-Rhodomonas_salina.1
MRFWLGSPEGCADSETQCTRRVHCALSDSLHHDEDYPGITTNIKLGCTPVPGSTRVPGYRVPVGVLTPFFLHPISSIQLVPGRWFLVFRPVSLLVAASTTGSRLSLSPAQDSVTQHCPPPNKKILRQRKIKGVGSTKSRMKDRNPPCLSTNSPAVRNQIQETAFLAQFVLKMWCREFDFGL